MREKHFYSLLALTTASTLIALGLIYHFAPQVQHWAFSLPFLVIMCLFTFRMYKVGYKAANDTNPYVFTRKFLAFTGMKILIALVAAGIYKLSFPEADKSFLYSFLVIYILYTVLETYIFMKLSSPEIKPQEEG
jgi:hypothetical protein